MWNKFSGCVRGKVWSTISRYIYLYPGTHLFISIQIYFLKILIAQRCKYRQIYFLSMIKTDRKSFLSQNSDFLLEVTVAATGRSVLTLQVSGERIFLFTSFPFKLRFFVRSFIIWERYRSTIFIGLQVYHCQLTNLLKCWGSNIMTFIATTLQWQWWISYLSFGWYFEADV